MNKIGYYFDFDGAIEHMEAICDWLRANDVTPGDVRVTSKVVFEGESMTLDVFKLNESGHKYAEGPDGPAAMTTLTVPVKVPPPDDVMAALRPLETAEPTPGGTT